MLYKSWEGEVPKPVCCGAGCCSQWCCSWEEGKKMDNIRLSVQLGPHGGGCISLKDVFKCRNKKARKPCRVTYCGGCATKRHELWAWLTIMTQNQDLSFALKLHLSLAYMTDADRPLLDSLGKVGCLQVYRNWWRTLNIPVLGILYHSGHKERAERKGDLVVRYGQNGKSWSVDQEGVNSEFEEQIMHKMNYQRQRGFVLGLLSLIRVVCWFLWSLAKPLLRRRYQKQSLFISNCLSVTLFFGVLLSEKLAPRSITKQTQLGFWKRPFFSIASYLAFQSRGNFK